MDRIEELIANQSLKCSKCGKEIMDEWEYHDNNGVCDDCYSIPLRKSRGLIIN
jgi:DNA-directed RNA polymerase subunit RPC12/RpoP